MSSWLARYGPEHLVSVINFQNIQFVMYCLNFITHFDIYSPFKYLIRRVSVLYKIWLVHFIHFLSFFLINLNNDSLTLISKIKYGGSLSP